MAYELVIRNGSVVDGSGSPRFRADVGIEGGRIRAVGKIAERGSREIDAEGHVVTPGFIDPHTHLDAQMFWDPVGANSCWHGVTTAVMGNCGFTLAPGSAQQSALLVRNLERAEDMSAKVLAAGIDWTWTSYPEYLDALEALPKGIHYAPQVGHSALRCHVMGERAFGETASEDELARMEAQLEQAMRAGAWGFTTSRTIHHQTPDGRPVASRVGTQEELWRLLRVAGRVGGGMYQYVEDPPQDVPLAEHEKRLVELSLQTGLRFVIAAAGNPERVLPLLDRARAAGTRFVGVTHPRGICNWASFQTRLPFDGLPEWAEVRKLPLERQRAVFGDPAARDRLVRAALGAKYVQGTGAEARVPDYDRMRVLCTPTPPWPTVNELAAERGLDPVSLIIALALESDFQQFFVQPLAPFDREHIGALYAHPDVVLGFSDSGAHVSQMADASITTHMLAYWVREQKVFGFEQAVRLMTSAPALAWGLPDRGLVREGMIADLNVIDPETVGPRMPVLRADLPAEGQRIEQRADGIRATIVAGVPLVECGEHTGAHPGTLLRRRAA
jgi:N-acyl-D-aspartate/D-glutamate deacylase